MRLRAEKRVGIGRSHILPVGQNDPVAIERVPQDAKAFVVAVAVFFEARKNRAGSLEMPLEQVLGTRNEDLVKAVFRSPPVAESSHIPSSSLHTT